MKTALSGRDEALLAAIDGDRPTDRRGKCASASPTMNQCN